MSSLYHRVHKLRHRNSFTTLNIPYLHQSEKCVILVFSCFFVALLLSIRRFVSGSAHAITSQSSSAGTGRYSTIGGAFP